MRDYTNAVRSIEIATIGVIGGLLIGSGFAVLRRGNRWGWLGVVAGVVIVIGYWRLTP